MANRDTQNAYLFSSIMQHYMVKSKSMLGPWKLTSREGNIFIIREMKMQEICDLIYLSTSEHHSADQPKTYCTSARSIRASTIIYYTKFKPGHDWFAPLWTTHIYTCVLCHFSLYTFLFLAARKEVWNMMTQHSSRVKLDKHCHFPAN